MFKVAKLLKNFLSVHKIFSRKNLKIQTEIKLEKLRRNPLSDQYLLDQIDERKFFYAILEMYQYKPTLTTFISF